EAPAVHAGQEAAIGVMRLIEIRRAPVGLYRVGCRSARHDVGHTGARIEARIGIICVPAAIVIFHDVDDLVERRRRLESVIAESPRHLTAHRGMVRHGQHEMRPAFRRGLADHNAPRYFFSPAALAASFHLAVSATMKRANSSGPPVSGSKPWLLSAVCASLDLIASGTARATLSTISGGVPAGAIRPNQMLVSKSGMPASAMVGRLGAMLGRFAAAEASAISLPASTCAITAEAGENITAVRPAIRSVTACGLPW